MAKTMYASFVDVTSAEKAAGALLDKGVKAERLSLMTRNADRHGGKDKAVDAAAKGITTTTPGDAGSGAVEGAGVGLGVGVLAAVASLVVPGFGIVLGGGALAVAIAGALGTAAAGAVSGGALGYLKDQGVDDEMAGRFVADLDAEGALLSVDLPSGDVTYADVKEVFHKYHGLNVYAQDARVAPNVRARPCGFGRRRGAAGPSPTPRGAQFDTKAVQSATRDLCSWSSRNTGPVLQRAIAC